MLNKLVSVVICFPTESADIVYIDPMHPGTHPIINQSNKQTNKQTKKKQRHKQRKKETNKHPPTQRKKERKNQSINQSFSDFLLATHNAQDKFTTSDKRLGLDLSQRETRSAVIAFNY